MQKKPFTELGLSPELLKAVEKLGFEEASPIQSAAIPALLTGRDVVGQSQTGSGKTAAFAVPAIEKVDPHLRQTQVLILCPTRELAMQVAEEVAKLATFKRGVRELPIYGGASYERQFRGLQEGAHIVIGTPGRVIDHLDRGSLKLDTLKMVILDECDRMLDMGFREDIERILSGAPEGRQTALFSATFPREIQDLVRRFTREPEQIRIETTAVSAPAIDQVYYEVDRRSKVEVLCRLIDVQDIKYSIVFCATKMMCDELTEALNACGYNADKLHGDMSQAMRERVVKRFRDRKVEILVATDVAARGLDIDDIEVVFNYDLPQDAEDYVHRIGRTGRAGRSGRAISFVAGREIWKFEQFQRRTKARVRREKVPTIDEVAEKLTTVFAESLRGTLEKAEYKRYDAQIDQLLDAGYSPTDIASALMHMLSMETTRETSKILEDDPNRGVGGGGGRKPYPKYESRYGGGGGGGGGYRGGDRGGYPARREDDRGGYPARREGGAEGERRPYPAKRPPARPAGDAPYERAGAAGGDRPYSRGPRPSGGEDRPYPRKDFAPRPYKPGPSSTERPFPKKPSRPREA